MVLMTKEEWAAALARKLYTAISDALDAVEGAPICKCLPYSLGTVAEEEKLFSRIRRLREKVTGSAGFVD